jgi:hypothetical protein
VAILFQFCLVPAFPDTFDFIEKANEKTRELKSIVFLNTQYLMAEPAEVFQLTFKGNDYCFNDYCFTNSKVFVNRTKLKKYGTGNY